ncbi:hypothetical protein M011DRAFT_132648 [Sporormia fimetaria CBS 119925]|uniref:Uncharacterized protein n=1 Tax=Sporormia fimetaria CBS 119925 TaxID=1340428 RepID=A0A6A6V7N7_9PLEO|nr:hypothetical protein M011DRAFT_132648 [Sporormia fimetaria CBS 119925]
MFGARQFSVDCEGNCTLARGSRRGSSRRECRGGGSAERGGRSTERGSRRVGEGGQWVKRYCLASWESVPSLLKSLVPRQPWTLSLSGPPVAMALVRMGLPSTTHMRAPLSSVRRRAPGTAHRARCWPTPTEHVLSHAHLSSKTAKNRSAGARFALHQRLWQLRPRPCFPLAATERLPKPRTPSPPIFPKGNRAQGRARAAAAADWLAPTTYPSTPRIHQ